MKKRIFYTFIFIFALGQYIFSQSDTLNKLNSKGKKTGYWKVLLDNRFIKTNSINDANFYAFELYDNGETVCPFQRVRNKKTVFRFDGTVPNKGKPEAITGTIKWYDKKNRLSLEDRFENGCPVYKKSFHGPKDKTDTLVRVFEELDFTEKYNGIPGTFSYKVYSLYSDKVTKYWFRKGNKGWRAYKIN